MSKIMLETNFLLRLILANPWQHKVAGIQLLRKGPPSTVPQGAQSPREHSPPGSIAPSLLPSLVHWLCMECLLGSTVPRSTFSSIFQVQCAERTKLNHRFLGKALESLCPRDGLAVLHQRLPLPLGQ